MDKIDKLYYINLKKRPDRNTHFLNECKTANIPPDKIKRFEALDGLTYNFDDDDDIILFKNIDYKGDIFGKKIMGNQLSHYNILKEMVEKRYNYIIICQDDVVFRNNFLTYLNSVMNSIPHDAEIINIGFHEYAVYDHSVAWDLTKLNDLEILGKKYNDNICILNKDVNPCSLAYIVTLKGAINLLFFFKKNGFYRATDWNYNDYLNNNNIFYGSSSVLCTGDPTLGSDIFSN
jgi:GR25 family glycosyltransferase involved in LPS biosynthesis